MKLLIYKILERMLRLRALIFPSAKRIVFESNPELSCNAYPVFKMLVERGLNKEYELVWLVADKNKYADYPISNVRFVNYPNNGFELLEYNRMLYCSKVLIYCDRFLGKYSKKQLSIYLGHGYPAIKSLGSYQIHNKCDYYAVFSDAFKKEWAKDFDLDVDKMITLGAPRSDDLCIRDNCMADMGYARYSKVIVWLPTFRKNRNIGTVDGTLSEFGLPLIENEEQLQLINEKLKNNNMFLAIKIHQSQNLDDINFINKSNVSVFTGDRLLEKGHTLYSFLGQADAYLTDYSSCYYEFLMTDKPIGLVIDDLTDYSCKRGLFFEDYKEHIKGEYIENVDELLHFIDNLAKGVDPSYEERMWAKEKYCTFTDYHSTERVCDFITELM